MLNYTPMTGLMRTGYKVTRNEDINFSFLRYMWREHKNEIKKKISVGNDTGNSSPGCLQ